ncbi:MAG: M14 family zinc carboxypeptidase, partial [Pseudomonadota bacterium]
APAADPDAAADDDAPAVVWLNYGVHGAESSSMDAAIPTLYHLAAAQGDAIDRTLNETVIVIAAVFNPDGHARRIDHVLKFAGAAPVTDPQHVQHQLWMEARTNHYWFDLNRDWLLQTQPEARAWIAKWHAWKPNVSADYHEMGSESLYYFHPGEPRRRNPLMPDEARELALIIAKGHADQLDKQGELYTSEEGFDNFYVGKGSTYPYVNGSVGFLFEAAAARGGAVDTSNGVRAYDRNIRMHFTTSLSTIEGGRANRKRLLAYQKSFFENAAKAARERPEKAYVLAADGDPARLADFVAVLKRHEIAAYALAKDVAVGGRTFNAGEAVIVPMAQMQNVMARSIFDRVTAFEENVFYDVSGWTLPLAYDLDYAALDRAKYTDALLGAPAASTRPPAPAPKKSAYGYLFDWDDARAPRALHRFLSDDLYARALIRPKTIAVEGAERAFREGAVFVPIVGQKEGADAVHRAAMRAAEEDGVRIYAVDSGNAAPGVGDLGSTGSVRTVGAPSVLIIFDDGPLRLGAGELWHLLDYKTGVPVTMRRVRDLPFLDLSGYTHIVLPNGYGFAPPADAMPMLEGWVSGGGVLIGVQEAAHWIQSTLFIPQRDENGAAPPGLWRPDHDDGDGGDADEGAEQEDDAPPRKSYADKILADAEHVIGGALFESDLDIAHPLAFGHRDRTVAGIKRSTTPLRAPLDPFARVAVYKDAPLLSGYASDKRLGELAGAPMLIGVRQGAGSIVLFADPPAFRATFPGTERLFLNAVFFGKAFDAGVIDAAGAGAALSDVY